VQHKADLRQLRGNFRLDLRYIATPHTTTPSSVTKPCLKKKKVVAYEKPFAMNELEVEPMLFPQNDTF
jgi:predicted dehydrogenase